MSNESQRLKESREIVGWSFRRVASLVGTQESAIRGMESGDRAVRLDVLEWMESLAEFILKNPPPPPMKQGFPDRKKGPVG